MAGVWGVVPAWAAGEGAVRKRKKEGGREDPDADPSRSDWRPGAGLRGRGARETWKGHRGSSGKKPARELITMPVWSPFFSFRAIVPRVWSQRLLLCALTAELLGGPYLFS